MITVSDETIHQTNDVSSGIKGFTDIRKRFPYNSLIGYINVNSLKEKVIPLREVLSKAPIDVLCVDENKLDSSVPDHQFKNEEHQFPPFRRDRNSRGEGN